jgi:hypothetical protein
VAVLTGKIKTKRKYGRRHIISFADMKRHYEDVFPKLTIEKAVNLLQGFGLNANYTKKSVHSKVRSLAKKAFNDPDNVRIGEQAANASLQDRFDPTPAMLDAMGKQIQSKIDAHIKTFLQRWGIAGSFKITKYTSGEIEWEITES